MRLLVTGGAGFIGSHTADALLKEGHSVRIIDNLSKPVHLKGKPTYLSGDIEFMEGDVRNTDDVRKALKGVDAVYHLAAYQDYLTDFSKFFDVNSRGTALLYEIIVEDALPVKKVIIASSQAVMGEGCYTCPRDGKVYPGIRGLEQLSKGAWEIKCPVCGNRIMYASSDETVTNPRNQYAMSKYTQELIGLNLGRRYGIPTVCMRYSIVQGPRQSFYNAYSGACRIFSLNLHFDKAPAIYEDGNQIRDYVNIEDVVRANLLVLREDRADFEVFNVGGGKSVTVLEFFEAAGRVFEKDIAPRITGEFRFGDTRHIFSDITKLRKLGWDPRNNVEKSVADYKTWLESADNLEDILEYAEKRMKERNVVRMSAQGAMDR